MLDPPTTNVHRSTPPETPIAIRIAAVVDDGLHQHAIVNGNAVTGADAASILSLVPLKVRAMLCGRYVSVNPKKFGVACVVPGNGCVALDADADHVASGQK